MKKSDLKNIIREIVAEIIRTKRTLEEDTTTGNVAGYNTPAAFSRRGGSKKAVDSSKGLGFELTNTGKSDFNKSADKLKEGFISDTTDKIKKLIKKISNIIGIDVYKTRDEEIESINVFSKIHTYLQWNSDKKFTDKELTEYVLSVCKQYNVSPQRYPIYIKSTMAFYNLIRDLHRQKGF